MTLDEEHAVRAFLWRWHGHVGLYGDDGELQCSACAPTWDYKRAPLAEVIAAATAARQHAALQEAEKRAASIQPVGRNTEPGQTAPQVELRRDQRGQLDDVVVPNVDLFRLERMDKAVWWMRCYMPNHEDIVFHITTSGREITIEAEIEHD